MATPAFAINAQLLQDQMQRSRLPAGPRLAGWFLWQVVRAALLLYALAVLVPALVDGDLQDAFKLQGRLLWRNLLLPLGGGIAITLWSFLARRRHEALTVAQASARIEHDWSQLTAPGWLRLTVRRGLWMGLAIAVTVGTLLAATLPSDDLGAGGRPLAFLLFLGATLAWTIPVSFLIRWMQLRGYRRLAQQPRAD